MHKLPVIRAAFILLVFLLFPSEPSKAFTFGGENAMFFNHNPGRKLYPILSGGKWGFIDRTGRVAVNTRFDAVGHFYNGRARVKIGGNYGYIDESGSPVIPAVYVHAQDFSEGAASVTLEFGGGRYKSAFIDIKGHLLFDPIEGIWIYPLTEGLAPFSIPGENANDAYNNVDELVLVQAAAFSSGTLKWGYINRIGKVVIAPEYRLVNGFSDGLASVCTNTKDGLCWGYIDKTGSKVIAPKYLNAYPFSEGMAYVTYVEKKELRNGFIDRSGRISIRLSTNLSFNLDDKGFSEGLTVVYGAEKDLLGFIDTTGKTVIAPRRFDFLRNFHEGLAAAGAMNKSGYLDRKGNWIIMPKYTYTCDFSNGVAPVLIKGKDGLKLGYIDRKGSVIWTPSR